jgi:Uma2 family endonuclease
MVEEDMATLSTPPVSTPLMSWEEFERLPDSDGFHRELIEGVLQLLPSPKSGHSKIASNAFKILLELELRGLGRVFLEAGFKLTERPPTWIEPDSSFLTKERSKATGSDKHFVGGPEIAVEVVSPSESAKDIQRKLDLLLGAGSQTVWVVYPDSQTVHVFSPDGTSVKRVAGDTLTAPFLSPDWSVPVVRLFED